MSSHQTMASGTGHTLITGLGRKVMSERDVDALNKIKRTTPVRQTSAKAA